MGTLRRFQFRNGDFCPRSRKSRDWAEAYRGTPPKRSCRLTPRLGKKTIYGWKLTKPCALMNPPGIIKRLCSFSFTKKKTNPKKSPLRRDPSGCPVRLESGGRCGTRPPTADSDSHSAYSSVSAMLGAPPRGRSNPLRWSAPLSGFLRFPAMRAEHHMSAKRSERTYKTYFKGGIGPCHHPSKRRLIHLLKKGFSIRP